MNLTANQQSENLRVLYLHHIFFSFSLAVFPILIPPLVFSAFGSVGLFFVWNSVWTVVYLLAFLPLFNLAMRKAAPRVSMVLGTGIFAIVLALMSRATETSFAAACLLSALMGLGFAMYWFVRHWFVSVSTDYRSIGKQISIFSLIIVGMSVIAPAMVGALVHNFSFELALSVTALVLCASLLPLGWLRTPQQISSHQTVRMLKILRDPHSATIRPALFCAGLIEGFFGNAFPIAFVLTIGNVMQLGYLTGLAALISALLIWLAGLNFDRAKRMQLLTSATWARFVVVICYPALWFFPWPGLVLLLETLNRITNEVHRTIQEAYVFGMSSKIHPTNFQVNKEVALNLGRLTANCIIGCAMIWLPPETLWIFIGVGGVCQIGWLWLKRSDYLLSEEHQPTS